jgi:hypothetical protein
VTARPRRRDPTEPDAIDPPTAGGRGVDGAAPGSRGDGRRPESKARTNVLNPITSTAPRHQAWRLSRDPTELAVDAVRKVLVGQVDGVCDRDRHLLRARFRASGPVMICSSVNGLPRGEPPLPHGWSFRAALERPSCGRELNPRSPSSTDPGRRSESSTRGPMASRSVGTKCQGHGRSSFECSIGQQFNLGQSYTFRWTYRSRRTSADSESGIVSARYCGTRDFRGFAMASRPLFSQFCPPHSHENSHLTYLDEKLVCRVTYCHYRRPRRLGWPRTPDFQSGRAQSYQSQSVSGCRCQS